MATANPRRAVDCFAAAHDSAQRGDRPTAARLYRRAGQILLTHGETDRGLAAEMLALADRHECPTTPTENR
jgi:hypothetical protein